MPTAVERDFFFFRKLAAPGPGPSADSYSHPRGSARTLGPRPPPGASSAHRALSPRAVLDRCLRAALRAQALRSVPGSGGGDITHICVVSVSRQGHGSRTASTCPKFAKRSTDCDCPQLRRRPTVPWWDPHTRDPCAPGRMFPTGHRLPYALSLEK